MDKQRPEEAGRGAGEAAVQQDVIPAPTPRSGLSRQRSSSSSSLHRSGSASPPVPVLPHPGRAPRAGCAGCVALHEGVLAH